MRELVGKAIIVGISAIFGVSIGNELSWSLDVPRFVTYAVSLLATVAIAWFLLSDKPR